MIVTIFGGSGFVGRYIAQRLAKQGHRIRVAVRKPNEAIFVRTYGVPGQVEPVSANVRDDRSVNDAVKGSDSVVNCVGILVETGRQGFHDIHAEGAERIASAAAREGAETLVHISAIGADPDSESEYAASKGKGEEAVMSQFADAIVLRPSIVFGAEDQFFNRFAAMTRMSPIIPLVGARTKFQPVFVGDVANAAAKCACGETSPGIYELGGPEVADFRSLMHLMLKSVRRRRAVVSLPEFVAMPMAGAMDILQFITMNVLVNNMLTKDQVRQLANDSVVSDRARTLSDFGIEPTAMEAVLESYLYCYRPAGQFTAIHESADLSDLEQGGR